MVFALPISCGRKYFFWLKSSPTSLIAGIRLLLIISSGFAPSESIFFTSSIILPLFPFKTAWNTASLLPAAHVPFEADASLSDFFTTTVSYWAFSSASLLMRSMYAISLSGLSSSISDANAAFIKSSCDGLAIAMVSPLHMAIVRNAVFTYIRSGSPKDIFESPHIVGSFFSSLQYAMVS